MSLKQAKTMTKSNPSFRLRQNAPQRKPTRDQPKKASKPAPPPPKPNGLVYPGGETAFKALLSARFCAAIWSHISDCDETYNYWEPTHFLIFGKGLQTWEYSPQFALRSYTYLLFHAAPGWVYHKLLQPNPLLIFYFLRCLLGLMCAVSEVYFYKSVCREFGIHIGRICLFFQLFAAGMFAASTALLPSTFAMYALTGACAAWWQQRHALAVLLTALGALLGWPFAALLGLPLAADMLLRRRAHREFALASAVSAAAILAPMVAIDSFYYGRLVIAPLNLVMYNVFGGGGPELYGVEAWSFYFVNGFVNFNLIWVLALTCPLGLLLGFWFVPSKNQSTLVLPHWLSLSPFYIWLFVFMLQPHKEERFLYPVYPMICLCAAICVDICQKLAFRVMNLMKCVQPGAHYLDYTGWIMFAIIALAGALNVSRVCALYRNYHAPLDLLMHVNRYPVEGNVPEKAMINVCLGKDWHRYPSSFFLPNDNWNVRFIKSEFDGMLPAAYLRQENATSVIAAHFNDENREEPSLYLDVEKCHFLLDLDLGRATALEPIYASQVDKWRIVKSYSFLDSERSSRFFRAFYIPVLSEMYVVYGNFSLLQATKLKIK